MLDNIITLAIILRKDNIFFYYSLLFEYIFLSHQQNIFPPPKQHQHIKKYPQHLNIGIADIQTRRMQILVNRYYFFIFASTINGE